MRRVRGLLDLTAQLTLMVALVAALLGFVLLALGPRTGAYRTVTMLTGSMTPGFPVGSVLVDRPKPTAALRVGDVLTYAIPVEDHRVVSHRVIGVERAPDGGYLVRTKGDANNGPDPWTARVTDETVWTARAVVPKVGSLILALRDPRLQNKVLYVLPALCAVWTLAGVWRRT